MSSREEKRKYLRINSRYVIRCEKLRLSEGETSSAVKSFTENISAEGMLFVSSAKYCAGDSLRADFNLPGWKRFVDGLVIGGFTVDGDTQSLTGLVTRVELAADNSYHVGVHFPLTDKNLRWAFMKYIYDNAGDDEENKGRD